SIQISRLNSMASRLAVYASSCGSPHHHARLAYDCSAQLYHVGLSPTGLRYRQFFFNFFDKKQSVIFVKRDRHAQQTMI
ncbi:MAG: hypothetical protein Q8Q25_03190, partial [bacterium]|nr:hypothetical protein [bacterium]